ncbi:hypothetical protein DPMN_129206 [Dreissena polymorpha]|uniref:Uncharacterized protein n=1 Tax=Dreissena polymorpha TaxID=45954 RepID=A0A9D4H2B1_DREPO|nr:hypothetical protein DPMN_129206 [Dreissena polymorpha]
MGRTEKHGNLNNNCGRLTHHCTTSYLVIAGSVFTNKRIDKATLVTPDLSIEYVIDCL